MGKQARKRAPHGVTSLLVLDALAQLHTQGGRRLQVSRADLVRAVKLRETTVDDRLRTLIKAGKVVRVGRALYEPKQLPVPPPRRSEPPGTVKTTYLPDGAVVVEIWTRVPNGDSGGPPLQPMLDHIRTLVGLYEVAGSVAPSSDLDNGDL